ncbi:MAG: hypothetical protein IPL33_16545 [Sphingobacteriales bacterium]|nr:hypothetical protein [Sphingobacteriales bacterium]
MTVTADGKRAYFAAKNDSMGIELLLFRPTATAQTALRHLRQGARV